LTERFAAKPYAAKQIISWVHQSRCIDFMQMSNISLKLRHQLHEYFDTTSMTQLRFEECQDQTIKWQFEVGPKLAIETVYIPEPKRATLCVSSQVGCALACQFCATGDQGWHKNLHTHQIIGQVWLASQWLSENRPSYPPITNIVFMGMGEPLLNEKAVHTTLNLLLDDHAYGLSKYRVTVSTSGIIPAMERLKSASPCALAVSLHAGEDTLRNQIVPINQKFPLKSLMATCRNYFLNDPKRSVTFEYVMLDQVNDQPEHLKDLLRCIQGIRCKINLIPFNPYQGSRFKPSKSNTILSFQAGLKKHGYVTTIRKERGQSIQGACGQLFDTNQQDTGVQIAKKRHHQ
jgi:23S rRNA (adenine2503-C2)-methyltransferase